MHDGMSISSNFSMLKYGHQYSIYTHHTYIHSYIHTQVFHCPNTDINPFVLSKGTKNVEYYQLKTVIEDILIINIIILEMNICHSCSP